MEHELGSGTEKNKSSYESGSELIYRSKFEEKNEEER